MVSFPFTAVLGEKVKSPDDYREVRDRLVADYQNYLDNQWTAVYEPRLRLKLTKRF